MSDHCTLVLKLTLINWGPKPFRTLNVWNKESGFKDMVNQRWKMYNENGNPMSD